MPWQQADGLRLTLEVIRLKTWNCPRSGAGALDVDVGAVSFHSISSTSESHNQTVAGSQKLRTMSFSLAGSQEWPKGMDTTPNIISNGEPVPCAMGFGDGVVTEDGIRKLQQLQVVIDNITSIRHGNIYAEDWGAFPDIPRLEEYNQQVAAAVAFNAELRKSLRSADLQTSFSTDSKDTAVVFVRFRF